MTLDTTSADRGVQLLDEALRLTAQGGLSAVTHRSVETAIGAPHGSVTYWFGNRDGLLTAMVDRLVVLSESQVKEIADAITAAFSAGAKPDIEAVPSTSRDGSTTAATSISRGSSSSSPPCATRG